MHPSQVQVMAAPSTSKVLPPPRTPPKIIFENSKPIANANIDKLGSPPEVFHDAGKKRTYQRGRFLGKGGFAKCYEVVDPVTNQTMACKVVNKGLLTKSHQREKMAQEITIHRDLKHSNIVEFYSYFEDDNNVYIVLELCGKKSLMEMHKRRRVITEPEARYFLRQLTLAVLHLHEDKSVIHRDLKLGNIFINDNMDLKVGDFGLATVIERDGERKKTLCGTPNYIAPEVLNKRGHSFEVDVWSIGCILYTLLIGKPPFETNSLKDTYTKIRRGDYRLPSSRIGISARNLIIKMLQVDPHARPTARQILTHEFLTESFIPKSLPVSCLTTAPRFEKPKTARPGVLADSNFKRPLLQHNENPKGGAVPQPHLPKTIMETQSPSSDNSISLDRGYEKDPDILELIKNLRMQILETLQGRGVIKDIPTIDHESEDPSLCPLLWISKWVDYSDKYGFGYQLSDDSIGVSFNDQTKLVLLPGTGMHYIDNKALEHYYSTQEYPSDLQKKVKLLNYFQQYMKENLLKTGAIQANTNCIARVPNLWTWFRTSRAVVMILSNGTFQINNFRNHTKMILCPLLEAVTTISADRTMLTFRLSSLKENGFSEDMGTRLKYALEKCEIVLGNNPKPGSQQMKGAQHEEKMGS